MLEFHDTDLESLNIFLLNRCASHLNSSEYFATISLPIYSAASRNFSFNIEKGKSLKKMVLSKPQNPFLGLCKQRVLQLRM